MAKRFKQTSFGCRKYSRYFYGPDRSSNRIVPKTLSTFAFKVVQQLRRCKSRTLSFLFWCCLACKKSENDPPKESSRIVTEKMASKVHGSTSEQYLRAN